MTARTCAECGAPVVNVTDPAQPEVVTPVCQADWSHEWESDDD